MKKLLIIPLILLAGCSTLSPSYVQYLDQTSKLAASQNAAEAACLLVIAEAIKNTDPNNRALLVSQIDKCRKDPIKIDPPKNILSGPFWLRN